jgi:hypothetical protein
MAVSHFSGALRLQRPRLIWFTNGALVRFGFPVARCFSLLAALFFDLACLRRVVLFAARSHFLYVFFFLYEQQAEVRC